MEEQMNFMLMLQFIRKVPRRIGWYRGILKVSLVRRPRSGRRTSETLQRIRRESAYAVVNISLREASRWRLALSRFPFTCYSGYGKRRKVLYVTKRKLIDGPFCVLDRKLFSTVRKNLKKFEKI